MSQGWPTAGVLLDRADAGTLLHGWAAGCLSQVSYFTPLALNKSPLSAHCYCFSLNSSYETISRKQESALSPSAYWTSPALFSSWGLIRIQHNLPIDCWPFFQSPSTSVSWLRFLFGMSLAVPNWISFSRTCTALVREEKGLPLSCFRLLAFTLVPLLCARGISNLKPKHV